MKERTLAHANYDDALEPGHASPATQHGPAPRSGKSEAQEIRTIAIAATFTADLLQRPLEFWMSSVGIPADIALAPYGQVMQELLSPASGFSRNTSGFNILLIRLEDWIRDRPGQDIDQNLQHVRQVADAFVEALATLRARTNASLFVFFCPSSSSLPSVYGPAFEALQRDLLARVGTLAHTHCWTHADVLRLYPIAAYEDPSGDRVGHIPYTSEYFAALATLFARRIAVVVKSQYKVIVLDCDNTLWKGICGEDLAAGVQLTPAHLAFQRLLVQQHDAGMLLCLCSKNNAADVEAVFKNRPEMPLREHHLVGSRVDWSAKSANLQSLARELDLGLDSFILIDDSAIECAEVRANCPSVLVLQFPEDEPGIRHFIDHVWAFDRVGVTAEARQRTAQYRMNRARNVALAESSDLQQFLASLELQVDVTPMQPEQLARVAELVQRTNQFNLTGIRRRAAEIEALCQSELRCLVVHVRDRFGDYGLVGALLLRQDAATLAVDTFVLSCRVLGRGVEHRIVNVLGRMALDDGLRQITLSYRRTSRNVPAWTFLERSFSQFQSSSHGEAGEIVFAVPAQYAEDVGMPAAAVSFIEETTSPTVAVASSTQLSPASWHETAYRLSRLEDFVAEMHRSLPHVPDVPQRDDAYIAPRTPAEIAIADIWKKVLRMDRIGVRDDFLELGGDSLLAVQVIGSIGSALGLELSIFDFFEAPTIEQLARKLDGAQSSAPTIESTSRAEPIPLSSAQQRLWFIDRLEGGSRAYHVPFSLRLQGELDRAALQAALDELVLRHESLRTTFADVNGEPVQIIAASARFELRSVDLSGLPGRSEQELQSDIGRVAAEEATAPFDLSTGPLIRGRLLRLSQAEHVLVIVMHHIVSDGWSIAVFVRELAALYQAHRERLPDRLPSLPIQYADYAHWQRQRVSSGELDEQLMYWRQHLQGAPALLEMPADRTRPAVQSYRGANQPLSLGAEVTARLKEFSLQFDLTSAMTLFAAWAVMLARLSGERDLVIGMPVANRRRPELEGLIGFFANTLAVRVRLDDTQSVADLLRDVKNVMLGAYQHQDLPFEQVVEALQPARSLSHSPIFQVMFVLQNVPRTTVHAAGLTLMEQEVPEQTAQFDLKLSLQESSAGIVGNLNYASDLFDSATAQRWAQYFEGVLQRMMREPECKLGDLCLIEADERRQILETFNATQAPFSDSKLLHELFEEQVLRTPDAVAVQYEAQCLTYEQLDRRANQLAHCLRQQGVGPDRLVGVCIERSLEMVIGLLGIIKAGGAYVPLDPSYPPERLQYMLENASPRLLLTQERLRARLPATAATVLALDSDWSEIGSYPQTPLRPQSLGLTSRNLAYVIYTSGSTGQPKGAMNEHRALVNRLQWMQSEYRLDARDAVLQKTPFSFDVSVWEFFWPLMTGARLVMARPGGHQDPEYLRDIIERAAVTTVHFVPSMLQIFLEEHRSGRCPSLRHIVCSGEELPSLLQNKCRETLPHAQLSNLYGPTEAAVDVTFWECAVDRSGARVPIGRPIANTQMYVLDRRGLPAPIGVPGEIFIGGVGVGRGYLNRPALTAERFVADPFSSEPDARLYKTGDLGRWRADGAIEYLGRNDFQVKIRGMRIELGEIESQLAGHEQVKDAVVVAREDAPGDKRLTAYVVPAAQDPPSVEALRRHLQTMLPEHMVPHAFVMLERLPLSPNGKLDRRALPAPQLGAYASRHYEAPQGEVEEILAGLWQGLLGVQRVGRHDNFFELGGHSLLIVQLLARLRALGFAVELRRVYESPSLMDLASTLVSETGVKVEVPPNLIPPACEAITPKMLPLVDLSAEHIERIGRAVPGGLANVQDIYPLVPLQEGILFHYLRSEGKGDIYVRPMVLSVASRQQFERLIAVLQAAIDNHDVLRTAVLWDQLPQPVQVVFRKATLPVEEIVLHSEQSVAGQIDAWLAPDQQTIDLKCAPLMLVKAMEDPRSGQLYVLLRTHHIVSDYVSQNMLTAEMVAQLQGQPPISLAPVPYRNHVGRVLASARTQDAETFFRTKLGKIDRPTTPFGLMDVHGDGTQAKEAEMQLETDLARRIRAQARRCGVSAATLFHAAWGLVVARTAGQDEIVFGTVLLGRLHGGEDEQRMLGMFINTLPLRLQLRGASAQALVEQTQRELIELLSHEHASLAVAQRCSGIDGTAPLFSALLNFRHSAETPEEKWQSVAGIRVLATQERTNYPIVMLIDDEAQGFKISVQTDRRVDPARVLSYMQVSLDSLTRSLELAAPTPVLELPILPDRERLQLLQQFNATDTALPRERLVHELFEEHARRNPDATAVVCGDEQLTYAQLNRRANQVAHALHAAGVGPDDRVALYMERSVELVVGLLAILKAGGAYVPLDISYPSERLNYMIGNSAPVVVLTRQRFIEVLPATGGVVMAIDCGSVDAQPVTPLHTAAKIKAHNLAYVIYTSGSTGVPKGVMLEHGGLLNLVNWHCRRMEMTEDSVTSCVAAFGFDAATWEIWPPLSIGATLRMAPAAVSGDAEALVNWWREQPLDVSFLPTPLAEFTFARNVVNRHLRKLLVGGDRLRQRPALGSFELINNYGPTESTVVATSGSIDEDDSFHIGRPIDNTRIYILDAGGRVAPIGVTGEIYIGGAGVARGYLGRPELTAERFLPDPFRNVPSARMYRTGDLGRWRADGTIEYLGRNDHQIKVRGFRIELGEIEAQLARCAGVNDAVVAARDDLPGGTRLVAYVTCKEPGTFSVDELRAQLSTVLPEYMVPGSVVVLEKLPLTPNGKLDRQALPAPALDAHANDRYQAPQGEVELSLATIWREVLGLERPSRQHSFFEFGGHSLLAVQAVSRANELLSANLTVTDLYRNPTIAELAVRLGRGAGDDEFVDLSREARLDGSIVAMPTARRVPAQAVLLTGATGFVGRFVLSQLLQDSAATIYCLTRAQSKEEAAERVRATLVRWNLWRDDFESRIVAVPGDLRLARLGIESDTYRLLCDRVDQVYHCGTSMNHLETYAMAKAANVQSAQEILQLAAHGRPKLINYISTLGVFSAIGADASRVVDESTPIEHERHLSASGYTASKWVGEKMFMTAHQRGIACNIFRLGLVWADSQYGRYDELQREYRILKSSLLAGVGIRNYRHAMAPTPVDYVARAVVHLVDCHPSGGGIFHIASSAQPAAEGVFERCNSVAGTALKLLPMYEWIRAIKRLHEAGWTLPVVPLVEFAFGMNEQLFQRDPRIAEFGRLRYDSTATQLELARAGIAMPAMNDELLRVCITGMFDRDVDLFSQTTRSIRSQLGMERSAPDWGRSLRLQ